MSEENQRKLGASVRIDLVRRLFPVAISLGIGTAIVRADWVTVGRAPNLVEWQQIAIVGLAIFATVLSWDGYLISVEDRPLFDRSRFAIDVTLVFTYMFLFVTSNHAQFWLPILGVIFAIYVVWDILTVFNFPEKYDEASKNRTRISTLRRVYLLGLIDGAGINRGPVISLVWAAYFAVLWFLTRHFALNVFITVALAFVGVAFYVGEVRGFLMLTRVALIAILLLVTSSFGCYSR